MILLVSTYELGHPPLATSSAAAFLERAGFEVAQLDVAVDPIDRDPALFARARLVAISVPMHTALRVAVRIAARARELSPEAHVLFFGLYAELNADHLLSAHHADSVLAGEAEDELVRLARQLAGELPERTSASGHRAPPVLRRLDYPVPSRAALPPLSRYAKLSIGGKKILAGAVESTRGCKHLCRHCPIPPVYGGRFFAMPREVVLADVAALVDRGAGHVTFADPDFLNGPTHAFAIARELHRRFPALTFDFTAKVEHLLARAAQLDELRDLGCLFVVSAVESLSDRVLQILDKRHTRDDVFRLLEVMRRAGITLRPSLLPFTPWSGLRDYRELVEWIITEDLIEHVDPVQLSVRLLVPPGSLLQTHPEMTPHLVKLEPAAFSWIWRHPDPAMDVLHQTVSRMVETAALTGEPPEETFGEIRGAAAGRRARFTEILARRKDAIPRLTEPWFC